MRSLAREVVFKYLFSRLFNQQDEGLFAVLSKNLDDSDKKFALNLLKTVMENQDGFLTDLETLSENFKVGRIFAADKCAIFIGMAELKFMQETPVAVVIDEAVKLSAKYSTENSTDFVNGILAEYVKMT